MRWTRALTRRQVVGLLLIGIMVGVGVTGAVTFVTAQTAGAMVEFSWTPTDPVAGQEITFDASASHSPNGEIVEYRWNFNDGTTVATDDPVITHTYTAAGSYRITLEIEDEAGHTSQGDAPITIDEPGDPNAEFTYSPTTPAAEESVTFDATDSSSPNGDIVEYRWEFGDGTQETTPDPIVTHTFDAGDWFIVTLTVEDAVGQTDQTSQRVRVQPPGPTARCTVSTTTAEPDEEVIIDATESDHANAVRYDLTGNGQWDVDFTTQFEWPTSYAESGTYTPIIEVLHRETERTNQTTCDPVTVTDLEEPTAAFSYSPDEPTAGDTATFDASASHSPNGEIVEYRWDYQSDGAIDATTPDPTITHAFDTADWYVVTLIVEDEAGLTDRTDTEIRILPPGPVARCEVSATMVAPGEEVTIDAGSSQHVRAVEFDFDGDGTPDHSSTETFSQTTTYSDPGNYTPAVRVFGELRQRDIVACPTITVTERSGGPLGFPDIPFRWIIPAALLLFLTGLGWYFYPFGGTSPVPPAGGGPDSDGPPLYETGVVKAPVTDGVFAVTDIGFKPDLLVLTTGNGDTPQGLPQRTAGWTQGVVVRTPGGNAASQQFAFSVGDDAHSFERGTTTVSPGTAFELLHYDEHAVDSILGTVTAFTETGFEFSLQSPSNNHPVGDLRLLYTAFATGSALEIDAGWFETPTEPGHQSIPLDIDASVVSLMTAAGPPPSGRTWTTDRSVGFSFGTAVDPSKNEGVEQAVWCGGVWPGRSNDATAFCDTERALTLHYQDGEQIAGRTSATVTELGRRLGLYYDRAYSGPHKLAPRDGHPVGYLAMDAAHVTPVTGVVQLPAPGESIAIDCGIEPGLVEVTTARSAAIGEPRQTGDYPFSWSTGTAIVRDGSLAQYVIAGAARVDDGTQPSLLSTVTPPTSDSVSPMDAPEIGPSAGGSSGWRLEMVSERLTGTFGDLTGRHGTLKDGLRGMDDVPESVAGRDLGGLTDAVEAITTPPNRDAEQPVTHAIATGAGEDVGSTQTPDDRVASILAIDQAGMIIGRDTVRVADVDVTGFTLAVHGTRVSEYDPQSEARPYVWYRAWPALEGTTIDPLANDD